MKGQVSRWLRNPNPTLPLPETSPPYLCPIYPPVSLPDMNLEYQISPGTNTADFLNLYATFIVSLRLSKNGLKVGYILPKTYPYAFSMEEAVQAMTNMSVSDDASHVRMVCTMPESRAQSLLIQFMTARLIHCPEDRTRDAPVPNIPLQPTAKGIFFVQRYCRRRGVSTKSLDSLFASPFNSMRCITFTRSSADEIIHSKYLILLLFQRFAGRHPNLYRATNPSEGIPLPEMVSVSETDFLLVSPSRRSSEFASRATTPESLDLSERPSEKSDRIPGLSLQTKSTKLENYSISPYHHRYFTHPDSDSLTQYYVSSRGVRLKEKVDIQGYGTYTNILTGRAAWQWMMECCEVVNGTEIVKLLCLFLTSGFIEPVGDRHPEDEPDSYFMCSKDSFYQLTETGMAVAGWTSSLPVTPLTAGFPSFVRSKEMELSDTERMELQEIAELGNITGDPTTESGTTCLQAPERDGNKKKRKNLPERLVEHSAHEAPSLRLVLADPGLAMLFRAHLESSLCLENHNVYTGLEDVIRKVRALSRAESTDEHFQNDLAAVLTVVFSVYESYLSPMAPREFNMPSKWRDQLCTLTSRLRQQNSIQGTFGVIKDITKVYKVVKEHSFRMMEIDSLPKFLESKDYRRSLRTFRYLEDPHRV